MKEKKIAGIVSEYNPFHKGHEYQINEIRKMGYEKIVCVMSGNSTQRGELAITDKYKRAEAAVRSGADLVVELPYPYSSSGAEFFAAAGVKILAAAGVDSICFGSESADIEKLTRIADICENEAFLTEYKALVQSDKGSASAFFEAYKKISGEQSELSSNDLLGVAYIRAIMKNELDITPVAIKREGSGYTDADIEKLRTYPSALMIREAIKSNKDISGLMPAASLDVLKDAINGGDAPADIKNIESAVLAFLRLADPEGLSEKSIAECGGGLAEKLCKSAKLATSHDELVELAKGKKYTDSRVRRAILACMTGATDEDIRSTPAYSTVLAFNDAGKEILSSLRKKETDIKFITKPSDAKSLSDKAKHQFELSEKLDSIYTLAKPKKAPGGEYITHSPFIN